MEESEELIEAKRKLKKAIEEYCLVDRRDGGFEEDILVFDWVLVTTTSSIADYPKGQRYAWLGRENQAWHQSLGLVVFAQDDMLRK